jgi:hypothetical protein
MDNTPLLTGGHSVRRFAVLRHAVWLFLAVLLVSGCGSNTDAEPTASSERIAPSSQRQPLTRESLIIQCRADCGAVVAAVENADGVVVQRYANVDAIAASIPAASVDILKTRLDIASINKDSLIKAPTPYEKLDLAAERLAAVHSINIDSLAASTTLRPQGLALGNNQVGSDVLHQQGFMGDDVVVAVIDSGTTNNPATVPVLADSVIGGESFVPVPGEPSATSTANDDHGTWVASLIAGHGELVLAEDSALAQAISTHAPASIAAGDNGDFLVSVTGTAPGSRIYALKVFGKDEPGAPRSRTLAAIDRILTLKQNFNNGDPVIPVAGDGSEDNPFVYDALNIQVVNLSLGGPTLFPGNDVEDILVDRMLQAGITVVASAGNEGFAAMTGASPGTSVSAITVGAASAVENERILRDLQLGPGSGDLFRPTDHLQVALFSSRGPTADGRIDPDIVANGVATLVQGADGSVSLVSGTSFSAPTVAGAAALLQGAYPLLTATQIRSALIASANGAIIGGNAQPIDSGRGLLDVSAAYAMLEDDDDELDGRAPSPPDADDSPEPVAENLEDSGFDVVDFDEGLFSTQVTLVPGETRQFFVPASQFTEALNIALTDITPALPPEEQNQLFGDDLVFTVVDTPVSFNEDRFFDFVIDDTVVNVDNPQTGLLRIAIMGDWTNVGDVSAMLEITEARSAPPPVTRRGEIEDEEADVFQLMVAPETTRLNFTLSWRAGWAFYPAHDLDLILEDPAGELVMDGATLASPERVVIEEPAPGAWTVVVDGFMLHGFEDDWALSVTDQDLQPVLFVSEQETREDEEEDD